MKNERPPHNWLKAPGPVAPGLRIGLLGGSFNPAHEGHLHISDMAMKRLGLDYVWWLVSPQNPLKPTIGMAPLTQRMAYAAAKFEHNRRVFVVDIERDLQTRYTIDTLTKLQRRFPHVQFVWLMGSDNLVSFRRWRRWQDILKRVPVAVVVRPGSVLAPLQAKAAQRVAARRCETAHLRQKGKPDLPCFTVIDGPRNPLSSTQIRSETGWADLLVGAIPT
ncbi:MAG TPA: nicotinate-nucleotide adenylyltransferase [Rhizomicrobium sp.]|nr:nicotinate-nucleotide adenylyltransferase [Rhizomicrobium sp.]